MSKQELRLHFLGMAMILFSILIVLIRIADAVTK